MIPENYTGVKTGTPKSIVLVYNILVLASCILGLFSPKGIFDILFLIYPLIGVAIMALNRGVITLFATGVNLFYRITTGLVLAVITLLIHFLSNYYILDYGNIWFPFLITALIFGLALWFADVSGATLKKVIIVPVLSIFFALSALGEANCYFDHSTGKQFQGKVINHRISKGKTNNYYITVSPWGPQPDSAEMGVTDSVYNVKAIGAPVTFVLKKGLLNAPWYTAVY